MATRAGELADGRAGERVDELVDALVKSRDALLAFCDALSDSERRTPIGDGLWSAHDLTGHLAYWEQQTLRHLRETFTAGRPTRMPPSSLGDDLNGREARKRHGWRWARVRAEFVNTRAALIRRIQEMRAGDLQFYIPSPWGDDTRFITLETLVREDVLGHSADHLRDLRTYQRQ